ncbi:SRPBCC family protein [Ferrovibrio xuzhouensis]|uniref:SRPBCC family protein n=1 Tax=Ferrovibrio xuzhouensis TaxID=1576914 RepID=A0ABV7VHD0_9PROT
MTLQRTTAAAYRVIHAEFTIERVYDAAPARVYAAFADVETKQRWSFCHSEWPVEHVLDFRPGGRETIRTGPPGGIVHLCDALYHDTVPAERIIYSYAMHLDAQRISVSLVTVQLQAEGSGRTRLTLTEQGAYLDDWTDVKGREEGMRLGLDNLAEDLRRPQAA